MIADAVALRTTFPLSDDPGQGTIEVWFDDTQLSADRYQYDPGLNVVTTTVPAAPTDTVSILYEIQTSTAR
ncbi:MAG: hypothetical protein R3F59_12380 [Myxococcota bacterium]